MWAKRPRKWKLNRGHNGSAYTNYKTGQYDGGVVDRDGCVPDIGTMVQKKPCRYNLRLLN